MTFRPRLTSFTVLSILGIVLACGKFSPLQPENTDDARNKCAAGKECIGTVGVDKNKLECSLLASSTKINKGQPVTIFIVTDAEIVSAKVNDYNVPDLKTKSLEISPAETKKFTATIQTYAGKTGTCETEVEVIDPGTVTNPLPTCTISTNKAEITDGDSVRISITSTHSSTVSILNKTTNVDTPIMGPSGSQDFSPKETTIYEGHVTGAGGTNTCNVAVKVNPKVSAALPTCTLSANTTTITRGGSVTLTQTTANAVSATLNGATASIGNQTFTKTPVATTEYKLAVTNSEGASGDCSVTITVNDPVNPAPSCTLAANPTSISAGGSSIITMTATNATSGKINGTNVNWSTKTLGVSPIVSTTYSGEVSGPGGTAIPCTNTATVTVSSAKPTCTLSASATEVIQGSSVRITITPTGATSAKINGTTVSMSTKYLNFIPTATTTYRGVVSGGGFVDEPCSNEVTVNYVPKPICTVTAPKTTINLGESITLSLSATNATSGLLGGNSITAPGSFTFQPTTTTSYAATATGPGGTTTCTGSPVRITVVDTTPRCVISATSPVYAEDPITVNVNFNVMTSATVYGQTIYASSPSKIFTAQATAGTMNFTGTAYSPTAAMTCTPAAVTVLARPQICTPNQYIQPGEPCTVTSGGGRGYKRQRCNAAGTVITTDPVCTLQSCSNLGFFISNNACVCCGVGHICSSNATCTQPNTFCNAQRRCQSL